MDVYVFSNIIRDVDLFLVPGGVLIDLDRECYCNKRVDLIKLDEKWIGSAIAIRGWI